VSQDRSTLRPDCPNCAGLCCVALPFAASADFAIDKAAGQPCPHLRTDFQCRIHSQLRERGFPGCAAYDCYGAGQKITQSTFAGQDWRRNPQIAQRMFAVVPIVQTLHELLWYLTDALTFEAASSLHPELGQAREEIARLADQGPDALVSLDIRACRRDVEVLLDRASVLVREEAGRRYPLRHRRRRRLGPRRGQRAPDLAGAELSGVDLVGADLRGALLIGANLRAADLRGADVRAADFRSSDLPAQAHQPAVPSH
jgi:pentapeptide repeat protein